MINFFRKTRKKMADDNKPTKYARYAVGEIVLVVIGILIALQINNWNINNEKDGQFNMALDQIYTSLKYDYEMQKWHIAKFNEQLIVIDSLLNNDFDNADSRLPLVLSYLDWLPGPGFPVSNSDYYISQLQFKNKEIKKSNLAFQISSYFSALNDYIDVEWNRNKIYYISPILRKRNIPVLPSHSYLLSNNFNSDYQSTDSTMVIVKSLIKTQEFKSALLSTRLRTQEFKYYSKHRNSLGLALIQSIKNFNPNTQLKIDDIYLVGSALGKDSIKGIPMQLTDIKKCVWEVEIRIKTGEIGFMSRSKPSIWWGGTEFPAGKFAMWNRYVPVSEGTYRIVINFEDMKYQFLKDSKH